MRIITFYVYLLLAIPAICQDGFQILEKGLTPSAVEVKLSQQQRSLLYEKAISWINQNRKPFKLALQNSHKPDNIKFSSTKWNAAELNGSYYIARYQIELIFNDGGYRFEPIGIDLKINSKYDMGWKPFDLSDGSPYCRKGKVIKKYRSYLAGVTARLNELHADLTNHLLSN